MGHELWMASSIQGSASCSRQTPGAHIGFLKKLAQALVVSGYSSAVAAALQDPSSIHATHMRGYVCIWLLMLFYMLQEDLRSHGPASDRQQAAVLAVSGQDGFNWGYDPVHWGVPEGSYATDPDGVARSAV